jgi:hypothetical protein
LFHTNLSAGLIQTLGLTANKYCVILRRMGEKRDKRRLKQREELQKLMDKYVISPDEFNDIIDKIDSWRIQRIDIRDRSQIRKLYNMLAHQ